ncbi:hypothetical protein WL1483_1435 [Aeromonas schubertii]|uniref:Uncharacterized protein n=1 Tax=Aeromonas schubertii TaxID=652 RepID=A0A0S2SGL3_9GAMM|nr:hypothetical protein WL1483_1435 [Aeromonas schubertii]
MIGLLGALIGSVVSTRLMQKMIRPLVGETPVDDGALSQGPKPGLSHEQAPTWLRVLNSLLDGGKSGVELGMAVIPGVLIISTFVMLLTFGPGDKGYTGEAFQGVALLPVLAAKIGWLFELLFGFTQPELVAFPVTSLGAVGAAMSLVPPFIAEGWIGGNEIAVFTAMGMCWSGFLSTHTAMLDALGYRHLTSRAIVAHTVGGLCAGVAAHQLFALLG